jgi:hypothetical protein
MKILPPVILAALMQAPDLLPAQGAQPKYSL